MGDFYHLNLKCAACNALNKDTYYAESSGATSFTCENCKKINWIYMGFTTKIISSKKEEELYRKSGFGDIEDKSQKCTNCERYFNNPLADLCSFCFEEA